MLSRFQFCFLGILTDCVWCRPVGCLGAIPFQHVSQRSTVFKLALFGVGTDEPDEIEVVLYAYNLLLFAGFAGDPESECKNRWLHAV